MITTPAIFLKGRGILASMHRIARFVTLAAAPACAPTFAPPLRTQMGGAPGRVAQGDVEVAGATTGRNAPAYGGPTLAIGVSPRVAIEGGGEFAAAADGNSGWALGFAGTRITGRIPARRRLTLVGDNELGIGAGVGGRNCEPAEGCDSDRRWYQRSAGGAYAGFGGALRWRVPALYTRIRAQVMAAQNIPVTAWTTWSTGLELRFVERVSVWAGVGLWNYHNRVDGFTGGFYELGLAVTIPR